jgi:hypothetical protein
MSAAQPQNDVPSTTNVDTLHTFDTKLCADSVEFCPSITSSSEYFVCGTYQLSQHEGAETSNEHVKSGNIQLFKLLQHGDDEKGDKTTNVDVIDCGAISTNAILDLKW